MKAFSLPFKRKPALVASQRVFAGIVNRTVNSMTQNSKGNPDPASKPEVPGWSHEKTNTISEAKRTLRLKARSDDQDQFLKNVSLARAWLEATHSALDQLNDSLLKAKKMTIQMTAKTSDHGVGRRTAKELEKLLANILKTVDTQVVSCYPFSQAQTTTSFSQKAQREPASRGSSQKMELEIQPGLNMKLSLRHSDLLTKPLKILGEDCDLHPGIDSNTRLCDLNVGKGVNLGSIRMNNTSRCWDINLHQATTVGEVIDAINSSGIPGWSADINASKTGFKLSYVRRNENCSGQDLSVSGASGGTARDLGILTDSVEGSIIPPGGLEGRDLSSTLTEKTPTFLLKGGRGMILGAIKFALGDTEVMVNLGPASSIGEIIYAINDSIPDVIASVNDSKKGISVESKVAGKSLVISDGDEKKSARALGISGSPDILGALSLLMEGLNKADRKAISEGLETLDLGLEEISNHRAKAETKFKRLESVEARLKGFQPDTPGLLSEISGADVSRAATDLANQQSLFQSALKRGTAMIQPALLDFIR